jgi:hypothetical protein
MDNKTPSDQPEPDASMDIDDDNSPLPGPASVPTDIIALLTLHLAGDLSGMLHIASKGINKMHAFFGKSLRVKDNDPTRLHIVPAWTWTDYPLHKVVPTSSTFNIGALTSFTYHYSLTSTVADVPHMLSSTNVGEILKRAVNLQYLECEKFALLSTLTNGLTMPNLDHLKVILSPRYNGNSFDPVSNSYLFAPKIKTIDLGKCNMHFPPMENYTTLEHIIGLHLGQIDVLSTPTGIRFPQLRTLLLGQLDTHMHAKVLTSVLHRQTQLETFSARGEIGTPTFAHMCDALSKLKQLKHIDLQAYWPDRFIGNVLDLLKDHTARIDLRISGSPYTGTDAGIYKTSDSTTRRLGLYDNIHSLVLADGTFELFYMQSPNPKALSSLKLLNCNVLLTNASTQKDILSAVANPYNTLQPSAFPNLRSFLLDNSVLHSRTLKGVHDEGDPFMVLKKAVGIVHVFSNAAEMWTYDGMPFPLYHILRAPNLDEMGLQSCADVSQFATLLQYIPREHHARLFPRLMTQFVPMHCCRTKGTCPGLSGNVGREKRVELPYGLADILPYLVPPK